MQISISSNTEELKKSSALYESLSLAQKKNVNEMNFSEFSNMIISQSKEIKSFLTKQLEQNRVLQK
jgi:hypothetical protein